MMGVLEDLVARLDMLQFTMERIEGKQNRLLGMELSDARRDKTMSKVVDDLLEAARRDEDADKALTDLFLKLADKIDAAKGDEARLTELTAGMRARADSTFKIVTENTEFTPSGQ